MKVSNALKKMAAKSLLVVESETTAANYNRRMETIANGQRLTITTQGEELSTIRVAGVKERDDLQADYHAGSYVDNLTQAFRWMKI